MFGNLAEMAKLMGKAKDIQAGVKKLREDAPSLEYSATGAGGRIKVTVSGDLILKNIEIADGVTGEELNSELKNAFNAALSAAKSAVRDRMGELTGGLGIDIPMF